MPPPLIALLTDFGLRDHYVASMKAVILGICPDATLLDITHEVPPQDVPAGALELEAVCPYLPDGAIVVAVVDPGVGSARRPVAVDTGRIRLVGPDNGIFSLVIGAAPSWRAVDLRETAYQRQVVSRTFEGRDRFGPVAAWLATGAEFGALGPAVDHLVPLDLAAPRVTPDGVDGQVLRVDRFGNLVTSLTDASVAEVAPAVVTVGHVRIEGIVSTYADVPEGALCALIGSTGRLEIAVAGGSAADRLRLARGAAVQVRRSAAA